MRIRAPNIYLNDGKGDFWAPTVVDLPGNPRRDGSRVRHRLSD